MKQFKYSLVLVLLLVLLLGVGCRLNKSDINSHQSSEIERVDFDFETKFNYAKNIIINNYKDYKELFIINPLTRDTLNSYVLALHDTKLPLTIEKQFTVIRTPINSVVCLSSSHVGALGILDLQDQIIGASNVDNLWTEGIAQRFEEGEVKEVGKGLSLNMEQIISLQPTLVTMNDHNKNVDREELLRVNIQTLYYNDWRELDLLARAEWIKVMGLMFCKAQLADSLFNETQRRYFEIKEDAQRIESSPSVFFAQDFRGVWFMPGSLSYIPAMIHDANGTIKTLSGYGTSLPNSFEQAYKDHYNDDYWFNLKGGVVKTLEEFGLSSEHYSKFKAFKTGQVYVNNKRVKPKGGNDFWESGAYYPDVILKDLVKIIHPSLYPDYETYYWRKLD